MSSKDVEAEQTKPTEMPRTEIMTIVKRMLKPKPIMCKTTDEEHTTGPAVLFHACCLHTSVHLHLLTLALICREGQHRKTWDFPCN